MTIDFFGMYDNSLCNIVFANNIIKFFKISKIQIDE